MFAKDILPFLEAIPVKEPEHLAASEVIALSTAISLKRIADAWGREQSTNSQPSK